MAYCVCVCVCVCTNDGGRGKRERLKYNAAGLDYGLGLLGPSLHTEYLHCAYSNFTLQDDLHSSYLRSGGIVQGGSRPRSSRPFGSDALLAAAHAPGMVNPGCTVSGGASLVRSRRAFVKLDESRH